MKLRNVLGSAVVGAGALLAANRALRTDDLGPPLGHPTETYRWRGFDVAYTEAGDPDDPDLLLLHGINAAASSHEFSRVADALAADFHVLAPDLPGFGHSSRPPLVYSPSLYVSFVEDFARDLTDDAACVASSLTGAYAALAAREVGFRELVLVCPTASTVPRRAWVRALFRAPVVGEALFNVLSSRFYVRYFLSEQAFADPAAVTDEWVEYDRAAAHRPGARYAPASFVSGFLDPEADFASVLAALDEPVTLVWGRDATITPLSSGRTLAERANARLVAFDDAKLLPHAEHPEAFAELVAGRLPESADAPAEP